MDTDGGMPMDWCHQQNEDEGRVRYELARAAELAATTGGHPEKAPDIERGLLEVAGLNKFELAA